MHSSVRVVGWLVAFLLLALAPLVFNLVQLDPGRGFWVNVSVAAGFVGLSLMGLQFVLAARWARVSAPIGIDVVLQFHREITYLAFFLIIAHPLILFVWDSRFVGLLNPVTAPWRARYAVLSVVLLIVLVVTAIWRQRLRIPYQRWQALHSVLAVAIVVLALLHVLGIAYYVDQPWERALWVVYSAVFIWIGVWVRIIKPLQRWRRRWRVVDVSPDGGSSTKVTLEPIDPSAYGPDGFTFEPGQFAWIHTGHSPFALAYHPFSFSSSADSPGRVSFTIKAYGEFTSSVSSLQVGHTVYLDGPWGHFSLDGDTATPGFVFLAGGIGITPMLSMLDTLADRGDRRPCWLFLGNRSPEDITGAEELEQLNERLNLVVVHALGRAPDGFVAHIGRIDRDLLDDVLPTERNTLEYFLCGPEPMMDGVESALAELAIPSERVHSERFAMA